MLTDELGGAPLDALVNDLVVVNGNAIYAFSVHQKNEPYVYGILRRNKNGKWQVYAPDCEHPADRKVGSDHGRHRSDGPVIANDQCVFFTREQLIAALRATAKTPGVWERNTD